MGWFTLSIDCGDVEGRDALLEWLTDSYKFELPEDEEQSMWGKFEDEDGMGVMAEAAWIAEYVYVTVKKRHEEIVDELAPYYDRATWAQFLPANDFCKEAIYYESDGENAIERARYEGEHDKSGLDVMYTFAMKHRFRFRVLASEPPTKLRAPAPGAFDAPQENDPASYVLRHLAAVSGMRPTLRGLAFTAADPALEDEDRRENPGLRQYLRWAYRANVVRHLRNREEPPIPETDEEAENADFRLAAPEHLKQN